MSDRHIDIPVRAPAATSADDSVLPFEVAALDLRGRVVRLGPAVDTILRGHDYPAPVAKLLGEAIVLTVLLGSALKFEGRFILQTQTDGPVRMLVVDFTHPGQGARLRPLRRGARGRRGRVEGRRSGHAARPRPSRHDDRPGAGHEPLPGPGRARGQGPRARRARVFPALRADSDPGAARGRRGALRPCRRHPPPLARRRHPAAVPAQDRRNGRASPISIPAMRRKASRPMRSPRTTPGSRAAR